MIRSIVISIVFVFLQSLCWSQRLDAYISPGRAQIGDTFELTLTITNSRMGNLIFPSTLDVMESVSFFSKSEKGEIEVKYKDSIGNENHNIIWKRTFDIVAWDTGIYVLHDLNILFNEVSLEVPTLYFSVETNSTKSEKFSPLKEYFITVNYYNSSTWMYIIPLIVFVIALLFFRFNKRKKRKKKNLIEKEFIVDPLEKVRLEIMRLRLSEFWKDGKTREHYTQLSASLKTFASEVLLSNNQELTTEDVTQLFAEYDLPSKLVEEFIDILCEADKVKFAQIELSEEEIKRTLNRADKATVELGLLIYNTEQHD